MIVCCVLDEGREGDSNFGTLLGSRLLTLEVRAIFRSISPRRDPSCLLPYRAPSLWHWRPASLAPVPAWGVVSRTFYDPDLFELKSSDFVDDGMLSEDNAYEGKSVRGPWDCGTRTLVRRRPTGA